MSAVILAAAVLWGSLKIGGTILYVSLVLMFLFAPGTLLAVPLIAHGMLKTQLFEAGFGSWVGLLASALLLFFLAPVQRLAERFAGAVMPNTSDTPEYAIYRKMQVYESLLPCPVEGACIMTASRNNPLADPGALQEK